MIRIKSEIDQMIFVTANTWKQSRRPDACKPARDVMHVIDVLDPRAPQHAMWNTLGEAAMEEKRATGKLA